MKRIWICLLAVLLLTSAMGCRKTATQAPAPAPTDAPTAKPTQAPTAAPTVEPAPTEVPAGYLPDGVYTATFTTDSTMFKVNKVYNDQGTLTVKDGQMTIHITLVSKSILNLYPGLAADAKKEGAVLLEPTIDTVDYHDGTAPEEVYGFNVPVPVIGEEFDLALIGKKGVWYDHKVQVTDPVPQA